MARWQFLNGGVAELGSQILRCFLVGLEVRRIETGEGTEKGRVCCMQGCSSALLVTFILTCERVPGDVGLHSPLSSAHPQGTNAPACARPNGAAPVCPVAGTLGYGGLRRRYPILAAMRSIKVSLSLSVSSCRACRLGSSAWESLLRLLAFVVVSKKSLACPGPHCTPSPPFINHRCPLLFVSSYITNPHSHGAILHLLGLVDKLDGLKALHLRTLNSLQHDIDNSCTLPRTRFWIQAEAPHLCSP